MRVKVNIPVKTPLLPAFSKAKRIRMVGNPRDSICKANKKQ